MHPLQSKYMTDQDSGTCPLCGTHPTLDLAVVRGKQYWRCPICFLAFMAPAHHPTPDAERSEYLLHNNDPADPGYRRFLDRLCQPLVERLPPAAQGLDYGCGPGPVLAQMLAERGFPTACYDPYFAPDSSVLQRSYDFITCTETSEHFFHPRREFDRLAGLLRPGGWLGLMTETMLSDDRFAAWWYVSDPTHVVFYHARTLAWIADCYGWQLHTPRKNVALFQWG